MIDAERNNRGGFLDEIADDHWMKADSKKMRALRAVAIEASLARIAMIAPKSAPDRALLARRIGETSRRADLVRKCAFSNAPILRGQRPGEPCFFFDSVMVDYENALFDLALIALPLDEARSLITRVAGGAAAVSLNPLQLVQALLDLGREAFRYGRVVGAIYRDTLELEVHVWLTSPEFTNLERARGQPEQFVVTNERVAGLRAAYVRGNDSIPAWRAEIAALRAEGLEPIPHERFVAELYSILVYICGQIVSEKDDSYRQCALRPGDLMQSAALATGPGGTLFSAIQNGGRRPGDEALRQQLLQQGEQLQQRQQELQALRRQFEELRQRQQQQEQQQQRLALNDTERAMPGFELLTYKQALCITGEDAATNIFDPQTRQKLREFAAGWAWGNVPAQPATRAIDKDLAPRLRQAVGLFPRCGDAMRNAYEVGVFTRDRHDAETVIARASVKLGISARPWREAIPELRKKFDTSLAGAPAADVSAEIDDALWTFIKEQGKATGPVIPQKKSN